MTIYTHASGQMGWMSVVCVHVYVCVWFVLRITLSIWQVTWLFVAKKTTKWHDTVQILELNLSLSVMVNLVH